ncbi:MAG: precorrin-4 C(11)-methyltransferase [Dehalococcoidales bacterium]|nr:precorrin-4 C(11)-methyltransferase [Dehalococcoidales bacterium]MDZ4230209.1 precorrin-4 C(11)-methyltransferase [Dehalococcoidales bacterium]
MAAKVYFIGAGPGAPDLITLRAKKIIEGADVIIYADSLISPELCRYAREGAEIHRSSPLSLEEITDIILSAVRENKKVARLHSGDPSIFGATQEQMALLDEQSIEYEIVPGVSSLFAAAAALKTGLTIPELTQTVIITRMEGITPVPEGEALSKLAVHRSTLAIFLSASMIDKVVAELLAGGYPPDTPAAVVCRASWEDETILVANLDSLAEQVRAAGITRQAIILVGEFLNSRAENRRSKLYDKSFKHGYRK